MANKVFERLEKKYLVSLSQRRAVEAAMEPHLAPDSFGRALVTSVYLDTPDREVIARSLEKPLYKEKLRLRAYGEDAGAALLLLCREGLQAAQEAYGEALLSHAVFFELKKKLKGIVYKRRISLSLPAAWAFLNGASYEAAIATFPFARERAEGELAETAQQLDEGQAYLDRQIAHELEAALARHEGLVPAAAIACQRTAWAPLEGEDGPRVTFDDSLRYLDLLGGDGQWHAITAPDQAVMELKAAAALPSWLTDALSANRTYPRSFSKYGEAARLMKKGA